MTKEVLIKLRNTLKGRYNAPLVVYVNNSFRIIDEANALQFTKWDDDNEILYVFATTNLNNVHVTNSNITNGFSVYATPYEYIEAMELSNMDVRLLPDLLDTMGLPATDATFHVEMSEETKNRIINIMNTALKRDGMITTADINAAHGVDIMPYDVDYYSKDKFGKHNPSGYSEVNYEKPKA